MHFIAPMMPQGTTQILPAVEDTKTADAENDIVTHIIQKIKIQDKILSGLFLLSPSFRKHKCTKRYHTCTASAYQDQLMTFQCENVSATISRRSPGHRNTEESQQKGQALSPGAPIVFLQS